MRVKPLRREDIIQAVRIAAREAAQHQLNPVYVEALQMAVKVLEGNAWPKPKRSRERIKGTNSEKEKTNVLIEGTSLVSDCCHAIVLMSEEGSDVYECCKCLKPCTASQTLSEYVAEQKGEKDD